jgi:hypothetical protein
VGSRPCSPRVPFEGLDWVGELPARESTAQPGGGRLELGSGEVATPARQHAALGVAVGVHGGGGMLTRPVVARVRQLTAEVAMEDRRRSKAEVEGPTHAGGGRGLFISGGLLASGLREGIAPWYDGLGRHASRELAADRWARPCGRPARETQRVAGRTSMCLGACATLGMRAASGRRGRGLDAEVAGRGARRARGRAGRRRGAGRFQHDCFNLGHFDLVFLPILN